MRGRPVDDAAVVAIGREFESDGHDVTSCSVVGPTCGAIGLCSPSRAIASSRANRLSSSPTRSTRSPCSMMRPSFEHDDLVDRLQRRQAVSDHERGAATHQLDHGGFDASLGLGIDARGRLVEHQEIRIAQPHPCECEQLRLAGRQPGTTRTEFAVDARAANTPSPTRSSASTTAASEGPIVEQRDVVAHGAGEQLDLLRDERDSAAQFLERDLGDRHAVEGDVPARRLDEPQYQSREGGLAAARAADDADRAAAGDVDVDIAQHRAVVAVVELDVGGRDRKGPRRRARRPLVEHPRSDGDEFRDAHHCAVGLLHGLEFVHDLLERTGDEQHELEQQEGRAQGDRAAVVEHRADDEGEHPAGGDRTLHEPPHDQEGTLAPHGADECALAVLDESPGDVVGGAVRPEILGGGEPFLDAPVEPPERTHLVGRLRDRPMPRADDDGHGERDVDGHPESEPPVDHRQHDHHPADEHRRSGGLGDHLTEELRDRGDVAVDALDQLAGCVGAVELVVETEHVARHREPQIVGGAPGRDRGEPGDDDREQLGDRGDGEEHEGEAGDLAGRGAVGRGVDDAPDHERAGDRERRAGGDERAEAGPTPGVGPQQRAECTPTRSGHAGLRRHSTSLAAPPCAPPIRSFRPRREPAFPDPTRTDRLGGNDCAHNIVVIGDGCSPTQPRRALRPRRRAHDGVLRRRARLPRRHVVSRAPRSSRRRTPPTTTTSASSRSGRRRGTVRGRAVDGRALPPRLGGRHARRARAPRHRAARPRSTRRGQRPRHHQEPVREGPRRLEFEVVWIIPEHLLAADDVDARASVRPLDLAAEIERFGRDEPGGIGISVPGLPHPLNESDVTT
jgi:hypothetical protein